MFTIVIKNWTAYDAFIVLALIINIAVWGILRKNTNKIYQHFNPHNRVGKLSDEGKHRILNNTGKEKMITAEELLNIRERMNREYAWFANLTTMFPLLGMLGTVISLIPMVNTIGTANTSSFFSALTSTFWGIVAALICKLFDSAVSYKIEDNEKHLEHLIFPK
jgi:chemotaxis protein MotA